MIPCDKLGKAFLCQTEGFPQKINMLKSCSSSDVMCKCSTCCLKLCSLDLVISCYCLLVGMACSWLALLLLVQLLVACPSPPILAAGCLSFSSWAWSWASVHLHGFAGWFLMCLWYYERSVVFFVLALCWSSESCLLWSCSSTQLLAKLLCCGDDTTPSVSVTELLVNS
jgi:hypothetical protein